MTILGLGLKKELGWTILMKCLSINSVVVKSAMTPSFMGRIPSMPSGTRPSIAFAACPTATTEALLLNLPSRLTTTTEGSSSTRPCPRAMMRVFAVPKSIAISEEKYREMMECIRTNLGYKFIEIIIQKNDK